MTDDAVTTLSRRLEEQGRRLEDHIADTLIQRRAISKQMGSMETSIMQNALAVAELTNDVGAAIDWSRKNHGAISDLLAVTTGQHEALSATLTGMNAVLITQKTVSKGQKFFGPFLWFGGVLAAAIGVTVAYGKAGVALLATHLR